MITEVSFDDIKPFVLYTISNVTGGPCGLYGIEGTATKDIPLGDPVSDQVAADTLQIRVRDDEHNAALVTEDGRTWPHASNYSHKTVNVPREGEKPLHLELDISTGGAARRQIIIIRRKVR